MPKKLIFPLLAALFELLLKIARQEEKPPIPQTKKPFQPFKLRALNVKETDPSATALDLRRTADALERIAIALEKLNGENHDSFAENSLDDEGWIILPTTAPAINLPPQKAVKQMDEPAPTTELPVPQAQPVATLAEKSVDATAPTTTGVLRKYLAERDITIQEPKPKEKNPEDQGYQHYLERLALHLGQNFATCQGLYKSLRDNLNKKTPVNTFTYSLQKYNSEETIAKQNKVIKQFCHLLQKSGLLEEYTYQNTPELTIQLKATGKAKDYLNGPWLEIYVEWEVARIVPLHTKHKYEALPNLNIIKDGKKTEIDLFFAVGQKVFCIEAKTRPKLKNLKNSLEGKKLLGLDRKAILVVVPDKSEAECQKLSQNLDNVRVARLDNLEQTLKSMLAEA